MKIITIIDQIVDHIRSAIFSGKFIPGSKLKEKEISDWLGVSRMPVREAFRILEAQGLVEIEPNKGAKVPLSKKIRFLILIIHTTFINTTFPIAKTSCWSLFFYEWRIRYGVCNLAWTKTRNFIGNPLKSIARF